MTPKRQSDYISVSCREFDPITFAQLLSLAKMKYLDFKFGAGGLQGQVFFLGSKDRSKLLELAPRRLFCYSLNQEPYVAEKPDWVSIPRSQFGDIVRTRCAPAPVLSALSALVTLKERIQQFEYASCPYLQDCVPSIGYDMRIKGEGDPSGPYLTRRFTALEVGTETGSWAAGFRSHVRIGVAPAGDKTPRAEVAPF